MYSIQDYVIQFVGDLWQVGGFLRVFRFPPTNKTDCHNMTSILLKVALNTITPLVNINLKLKILFNPSMHTFCNKLPILMQKKSID